jgi:hypothetical protein
MRITKQSQATIRHRMRAHQWARTRVTAADDRASDAVMYEVSEAETAAKPDA